MRRLLFISIACSIAHIASGASPSAPAGPIPLADFLKYPEWTQFELSPDGTHYAVLTGKYGISTLGIIRIKDKKIVGSLLSPEGLVYNEIYWVSGNRLVYTIGEQELGHVTPSATGEIFATDIDGKNQRFLYGYRAGQMSTGTHMHVREQSLATPMMITTLPKDDRHVLIAEWPWRESGGFLIFDDDAKPLVTRLDVNTGDKQPVDRATLHGAMFLADRDDNVRFALGRDDQFKSAVSWKPSADAPWTAFELPGFDKESLAPQSFASDGHSVYFTGLRDGDPFDALYRLDLDTKAVSEVHAFEASGIDHVIFDFSGRDVAGVVGYGDRPQRYWLDSNERTARLYNGLLKAFPGQLVRVVTASEDGRVAIVEVSSDVNPGDYYLFNTEAKTADYLESARRWIDPAAMRHKEPFTLQARDGLELHGYVTRPAGDGPYPMVVMPHGGPADHDTWEFDPEVQLLASRGYAVLQLNFRGSNDRGLRFEHAGHRQWGKAMQDDVTDATRWAIEQKVAQADRICIFGWSYGGYAALEGVVREPKLYRCAIGASGVYDLELMFSSADVPRSRSGRTDLETLLGHDKEDLHSRSPVYNADKIEVPVLLIHGKADWRADFEQATRMKAALEKNKKKFEWLALKGEGHGVFEETTRTDVFQHVLEFLDRNIGSARTAAN